MSGRLLRLALVAGAVFALDQWTKAWATATLQHRPPVEVIGTLVQLTYTRNSGVAFGLGAGTNFPFYLFSIAAAAGILWMFLRGTVRRPVHQYALALVLGGALGNLVDRLTTGKVVDFILLSYRQWDFPVFNVADTAVSVGVVLFAFTWGAPREDAAAPAPSAAAPPPPAPADRIGERGAPDAPPADARH